jgi:hypothetical protein
MDPTGNEALTEFLLLQFRPLPIMSWPKWCLTTGTNPMSGDLPACGTPGGPPPPPDPCPGYICKPSYEITVSFWPLGAKGFGHVGVAVGFGQVNDNTQGWATVQHWVMWGPVQMGVPVPGILKDDLATYPGKPHSYLHIPVDQADANAAQQAITNRANGEDARWEYYDLHTRNCAQFVEDVLHAGNVPDVPNHAVWMPRILWSILDLEY